MKIAPLFLILMLAGCDYLPRDPERTLERIEQSHVIRVGLIATDESAKGPAQRLTAILEQRTGARARIVPVVTEPAFLALDEDKLDIVIGPFGKDSPWATDVAFGPPLAKAGTKDAPVEIKAAMRNGENRWIMLVERASRAAAPGIADQ